MFFEGGEERSSMSAQRRQFVQLRRPHSPFHPSRLACPQMSLRRSFARLDAFGAGMVWGMRQAGASMATAGVALQTVFMFVQTVLQTVLQTVGLFLQTLQTVLRVF